MENRTPEQVLLVCNGINFIDLSGAEMLLKEQERLQRQGITLSYCGLKNTVKDELVSNRFLSKFGAERFYDSDKQALAALAPNLLVTQ